MDYRDPVRVLTEGELAELVTIYHSVSYRTRFEYDADLQQYKMQQWYYKDYRDTVDENNEQQLAFENLVVLFTTFDVYPDPGAAEQGRRAYDLQKVDYASGGYGYYFYGGKCERIRWQKGSPLEGLRLTQLDGDTPVKVNCGKTYLAVVDLDEYNNFKYEGLAPADGGETTAQG